MNTKIMILVLSGVFMGIFATVTIPAHVLAANAKTREADFTARAEAMIAQASSASLALRIQVNLEKKTQAASLADTDVATLNSKTLAAADRVNKTHALINGSVSDQQAQADMTTTALVSVQAKSNANATSLLLLNSRKAYDDALRVSQSGNKQKTPSDETVSNLKAALNAAKDAAKAQWVVVQNNKKFWATKVVEMRDEYMRSQSNQVIFEQLKRVEAEALASNKEERAKADQADALVTKRELVLRNAAKAQIKNTSANAKEALKNKAKLESTKLACDTALAQSNKANQLLENAIQDAESKANDVKARVTLVIFKTDLATADANEGQAQKVASQAAIDAAQAVHDANGYTQETFLKAPGLISQAREFEMAFDEARLDVTKKNINATASMKWGVLGAIAADIFVALGLTFWRKVLGIE